MFNRVHPPLETGHINIMVSEVKVDEVSYAIVLGIEKVPLKVCSVPFLMSPWLEGPPAFIQELLYIHQDRYDKNWVPWEVRSTPVW